MDSFDHVVVDEDGGAFVKCIGDTCQCKTPVQDVLLQCSSEVKMNLLKSVVADGSSAGVGYWAGKVELIAASQNIDTNDLVGVISYRATVMGQKAAKDIMAALTTGPAAITQHAAPPQRVRIDSSEQSDASEDSAITKLVWLHEESPTTKTDFCRVDTMVEVEDLVEEQQINGKLDELHEHYLELDRIMDLPLDGSDTDPEGDTRTTRFIQWARNVIGNGDESEYPLKHLTDSLIIHRFILTMNDDHGSLSLKQCDKVQEVMGLYEDKVNRYGGSSRKLQMSRINTEWTESNTGEMESYLDDVTPKESP